MHQAARQVPTHKPVSLSRSGGCTDHFKRFKGLHVTGVAQGEQLLLQISSYSVMTKNSFSLLMWALLLMFATGCQPDESPSLRLDFDLAWDGAPYTLGEVVLDNQGRDIRLDRMEAYVSQFALHDIDEGWVDMDTVQRIRFAEEANHVVLELTGCEDRNIDGLRMGLGVPADQNLDVDPAGYPTEHPLGFAGSAGMHWGWAAGYIFSVYDGRLLVDPEQPFSYHAGDDRLYRTVEFTWEDPWFLEAGEEHQIRTLTLDAYKCLHGTSDVIDPAVDAQTHTGNNLDLATRWVTLYLQAWTLQ